MAPVRSDCIGAKNSDSNIACRCRRTNRGRSRKTNGRRRGRRRKSRNLTNTSRSNARFLANVTTTDDPSERHPARPARCMWLARPGGTLPSTTPFKPPISMPSSIVVVDDKRFRTPSLNRNCLRLFSCGLNWAECSSPQRPMAKMGNSRSSRLARPHRRSLSASASDSS